jgi:hypothetical protein
MANTFTKIAAVEVGSGGQSTISFTSIPQTYKDLRILISARSSGGSSVYNNMFMKFNTSTTGYADKLLFGSGTSVSASSVSTSSAFIGDCDGPNATTDYFGSTVVDVFNYSSTAVNKTWLYKNMCNNNASQYYIELGGGYWTTQGTAITSIEISPTPGPFIQYTSATLYGIATS